MADSPSGAKRLVGHSLRWGSTEQSRSWGRAHPTGDMTYDPFDPKGPWTAECTCGDGVQIKTKKAGRAWHRTHKARIRRNGVPQHD